LRAKSIDDFKLDMNYYQYAFQVMQGRTFLEKILPNRIFDEMKQTKQEARRKPKYGQNRPKSPYNTEPFIE
jgi:hypothetical protein